MKQRLVVALGAACIAGAACGGSSSAADTVRSDSAGVAILTSPGEDRILDWRFERVGVLRDSVGEPWYFTRLNARTVAVRDDGEIFVLDGVSPPVEQFSRDGRHRASLGRRGGGPGEFQFPVALEVHQDTLYVHDVMKAGFVRFGPDGKPLGDRRIEESIGSVNEMRYHRGGAWMTASIPDSVNSVMGFYADSARRTPLHRVSTPRGRALQFSCVGMSGSTPMFSPRLMWSSAGERAVVHAQPGYELWVYRGASLEMSVRRKIPSRAPTTDDARLLYPDGWRVSFGGAGPDCVVPVEEVVAQQGLSDVMPVVQDVLVLGDGRIVVRRTLTGAPEQLLDVFAADGVYLGTLRGRQMPVAMLQGGEWLVPEEDEDSGGRVLTIYRVLQGQ